MKCYNWKENRLTLDDIYGNKFDFKLKGAKTIVSGKSASGKSFIYNLIKKMKDGDSRDSKYDTSNIILINKNNVNDMRQYKDRLIIIDRAEIILNKNIVKFINEDLNNRYLIFCRKHIGLLLSPNYYGQMVNDNGTFRIMYDFNVRGWN